MKEMFDLILDRDEEIIKVYKPNKKRYVTLQVMVMGLLNLIIGGAALVAAILGFSGVITIIEEGVNDTLAFSFAMVAIAIFFLLLFGLVWLVLSVQYKKTFYAFSNKRILIRTGFIGVDFTVLEMKLIGSTSISVGLLDKFITPNTGTIRFGSNSTPIGGSGNQGQLGGLVFKSIENAYETYREIKEVVDTHVR